MIDCQLHEDHFRTRKTHAYSFGGVVAHYKDAGMGWSILLQRGG